MRNKSLTGVALFELLKQLPLDERMAFAKLIQDPPGKIRADGLFGLTDGKFIAVEYGERWDLPACFVDETLTIYTGDKKLEFPVDGGGRVMTFKELLCAQNQFLAEFVAIKQRRQKPKKEDTRPLMLEIHQLQKELEWEDVFKRVKKKTDRWKGVESMRRAYVDYKSKHLLGEG